MIKQFTAEQIAARKSKLGIASGTSTDSTSVSQTSNSYGQKFFTTEQIAAKKAAQKASLLAGTGKSAIGDTVSLVSIGDNGIDEDSAARNYGNYIKSLVSNGNATADQAVKSIISYFGKNYLQSNPSGYKSVNDKLINNKISLAIDEAGLSDYVKNNNATDTGTQYYDPLTGWEINTGSGDTDLSSYIIPSEYDNETFSTKEYNAANAPYTQKEFSSVVSSNPIIRAEYTAANSLINPGKIAKSVSLIANDLINSGNEEKKNSQSDWINKHFAKLGVDAAVMPEAENTQQKVADVAGSLLGSIGTGALLGVGNGVTKAGNAIAEKVTNPTLSKALSSAIDNAILGLPQNIAYDISNSDSAGETLKNTATDTAIDLLAGGLLGGIPELAKSIKAVNATKKAEIALSNAKSASVIEDAAKLSDDLANKVSESISKNIDNVSASTVSDSADNVLGMLKAADTSNSGVATSSNALGSLKANTYTNLANIADSTPTTAITNAVSDVGTNVGISANAVDDVVNAIGERKAFNNIYNATEGVPTGTIDVSGKTLTTAEYADAVDNTLTNDVKKLQDVVDMLETKVKNSDVRNPNFLIPNIQLFAAKRKLEWLKLADGENGSKIRGFIQQRLIGNDEVSSQEFRAALEGKADTYTPKSDILLNEQADKLISTEYKENRFYNNLMTKPGGVLKDDEVKAGAKLLDKYIAAGDLGKSVDIANALSRSATESGRSLRAYALKKLTDPAAVMKFAQKEINSAIDNKLFKGSSEELDDFINRLSENIRTNWNGVDSSKLERIINKAINEMPSEEIKLKKILQNRLGDKKSLAERIMAAVDNGALSNGSLKSAFCEQLKLPTLDNKTVQELVSLIKRASEVGEGTIEQSELFEQIYRTLGSKIPVSKMETFTAWRKLAMLANPKTHLRNFTSNVFMMPMRKWNDFIASKLENLLPAKERTRALGWSFTDKGKALANSSEFKSAQERGWVQASNYGKYDLSDSAVLRNRKFFGESKAGEALNKASDINSRLLNKEDKFAFDRAFKDNLGQYLTARGSTEVTDDAFKFALDRSLEATFRAENDVYKAITRLKTLSNSKLYRVAADVVIPFSKTPANLFQQAFQYSPIGLGRSAVNLVMALKGKSEKKAADVIYNFAKGMNGSLLLALGLYLGASGIMNTEYGSGDKQRAADEIEGNQQYSIRIGDTTISIDWLQPLAFPLIAGGSFGQTMAEDNADSNVISNTWSSIAAGMDSVFQLSMLQSLVDLASGGTEKAVNSFAENVVSQSVPTVLGQVARSVDTTQRKVTGDNILETLKNTVDSKIPGLSTTLTPELDLWGNTVKRNNTDNWMVNAFNQMLNPATVKKSSYQDDALTQMMMDIYNITDSTTALPSAPTADSYSNLTSDQLQEAAKSVGSEQYTALQALAKNPNQSYKLSKTVTVNGKDKTEYYYKRWADMTDAEKAKILNRIFSAAKETAMSNY